MGFGLEICKFAFYVSFPIGCLIYANRPEVHEEAKQRAIVRHNIITK